MIDDRELLRRYSEHDDEGAFSELVGRHLPLVYAVARRRLAEWPHLAEEVSQSVFTEVARKAGTLANHPAIAAWLFKTTHHIAATLLRSERRRRTRESAAHLMEEHHRDGEGVVNWDTIMPFVDEAIGELAEKDREAVLLRFHQGLDFAAVGNRIALSEEGARARVNRGLEKIRMGLARRGIPSTAAALALAMAAPSAVAAPVGLAHKVAAMALLQAAAVPSLGTLTLLTMPKIINTLTAVAVVAGGTFMIVQSSANASLRDKLTNLSRVDHELAQVKAQNSRLAATIRETEDAASVATELEKLTLARAAAVAQSSTATRPAAPGDMVDIGSLKYAGGATPTQAFETIYWAKNHVDIGVLERHLLLSPAAFRKVEDVFARLPPSVRARFPDVTSPLRLVAMTWAAGRPLTGVQLEQLVELSPTETVMHGRTRGEKGRIEKVDLRLKKGPHGWAWELPDGSVDQLITMISRTVQLEPAP